MYEAFLKNVDKARDDLSKIPTINLNDFLMSDSDIAKKIYSFKNPELDVSEIDLMIDGMPDFEIDEIDLGITPPSISNANLPDIPDVPNFEIDNIDLDITSSPTPEISSETNEIINIINNNDVFKNILGLSNESTNNINIPNTDISNVNEFGDMTIKATDMAEDMTSKETDMAEDITGKATDMLGALSIPMIGSMMAMIGEMDTPYKKKLVADKLKDFKNNFQPLPKSHQIYSEVDNIKKEMLNKFNEFAIKVPELIKELIFNSINMGTSIAGAIQMVVTPVFPVPAVNVPGMITLLMTVLLELIAFCSKVKDVKSIFSQIDKLHFILNEKNLNVVTGILNALYGILENTIGLLCKAIDGFLKAIIDAISKMMKNKDNCKKIKKEIEKTEKELRKEKKKKDNDEKINELNQKLKDLKEANCDDDQSFDTTNMPEGMKIDSMGAMLDRINQIAKSNDLLKDMFNIKVPTPEPNELEIVYDIQFPNGEVKMGLSKEEVSYYEDTYTLIYNSSVIYEMSKLTPKKIANVPMKLNLSSSISALSSISKINLKF